MRLYLLQHGEALPKTQDPERPLSAQGRSDLERLAAWLGRTGVRVAQVRHSGKTRAAQSAGILAAQLAPGGAIEAMTGINPDDSPAPLADQAAHWDQDCLLVGHLPFMAKAASLLLCGDPERVVLLFRPGTLVVLERNGTGSWGLVSMIRPDWWAN